MQTTTKKIALHKAAKIEKDKNVEDKIKTSKKTEDEKLLKRNTQIISTPRNYTIKKSASDVYAKSNSKSGSSNVRAPKKVPSSTRSIVSPMKDLLKSTASSSSLKSHSSVRSDRTYINSDVKSVSSSTKKDVLRSDGDKIRTSNSKPITTPRTAKDLIHTNVTVNSPSSQRKTIKKHEAKQEEIIKKNEALLGNVDITNKRLRQKTRTLNESEVKVLVPDMVDNNVEMKNLNHKLNAKPKAFFIDLDNEKGKGKQGKMDRPVPSDVLKSSDEENYSYEDDFESYESDFESYHSDSKSDADSNKNKSTDYTDGDSHDDELKSDTEIKEDTFKKATQNLDEERMLDSGSFELREAQKSANKVKAMAMDDIIEVSEDLSFGNDHRNKSSLTDEGFLEMSSSSGVSSMKNVTHIDILDRPLFIDFKKSKENRRKRLINEQLKQRAKDLLSMITLHEMSFTLFEMKPIPYEVYMSTFGNSNYVQSSVQTFDDGVEEGIQTEEVVMETKWTQNPVKFSNEHIYLNDTVVERKNTQSVEDLVTTFTSLLNGNDEKVKERSIDDNYKNNPLRIYLEQRNGVGRDVIMSVDCYESKINNVEFSVDRLRKFLKRAESKVCHVLSMNAGNTVSDYNLPSKFSFSKGYKVLTTNKEETEFLKMKTVSRIVFSETKNNLIITVHGKGTGVAMDKCLACLWDIGVANVAPIKVMVAIDEVNLCNFRGNAEGIFIASLVDDSIHLWDLSEDPTWRFEDNKNDTVKDVTDNVGKTQTELDREWNSKNKDILNDQTPHFIWRSSAYTSSAIYLQQNYTLDVIVGLEFLPLKNNILTQDGERKIVGQFCSLQRRGLLNLWTIVQEKHKCRQHDIGMAYWSKMKFEKHQTINLLEYIDTPLIAGEKYTNFNLSLAKKRLANKRIDREFLKNRLRKEKSHPNSSVKVDRPSSVANNQNKQVLSDDKIYFEGWESGVLCSDLKIVLVDDADNYLIAKNGGEVLCCTRTVGIVKVKRFSVATECTTITTIEVSQDNRPYFLAGTNSGHIHLCSLNEARVLISLDCRSRSSTETPRDRCVADEKGRFLASVTVKPVSNTLCSEIGKQLSIDCIQWSRTDPCNIFALTHEGVIVEWDLAYSDLHERGRSDDDLGLRLLSFSGDTRDPVMALLTADGEVQLHLLSKLKKDNVQMQLFDKYVNLL